MENVKTGQMGEFVSVEANSLASEGIDTSKCSYWRSVTCKFLSNKVAIFMLILILVTLLMSFIQPLFSGYKFMDVKDINSFTKRCSPSSVKFWFGTDANGMSLFDVVQIGAKTSISISVITTSITTVIGIAVGATWETSRATDRSMLEIYSTISNVSTLLIVIIFSYAFGSGFQNLTFAMCVTSWLSAAYFTQVQVMIIRDRRYNLVSKALRVPTLRTIFRSILSYLTSIVMTGISRALPSSISYKTFLSLLGTGLSSNVLSLGRLITKYMNNVSNYPYLFWTPVTILALVSVSLHVVGQTLTGMTDPRTRIQETNNGESNNLINREYLGQLPCSLP